MNRLVAFGKDVLNGWLNAEAFTLAAALAYYAIFAIAPLLLISIYVASLFLDRTAAVQELTNEFTGVVGSAGQPRMATVYYLEEGNTARAVPIEKYFANVVAALGLGFLLGAAVALRPTTSYEPREREMPSAAWE